MASQNFYLLFRLFFYLLKIYFLIENKKKSNLFLRKPEKKGN